MKFAISPLIALTWLALGASADGNCPGSFKEAANNYCYSLTTDRVLQTESASTCAGMGAMWVTGEDIDENIVALQALGSGTFWTDAELTPQGTYNFSDGTVVYNDDEPLDPQSGRPLVVFAKKGFVYQRKEDDRRFFALCKTDLVCEDVSLTSLTGSWAWNNVVYSADLALINHACEVHDFDGVPNYWHSSTGNPNQVLIYDQGCQKVFTKVILRNSGNSRFNNVGIDSFTLEGSNDQMMWTNLASGNLVNPANYGDCDVPLEEFPTGTHSFQYIRLTAHTHFNSFGYGLMYMSVEA